MTPTSPAAKRRGADLRGVPPGHPLAVGLGKPDDLDRADPLVERVRPGHPASTRVGDQAVELVEVDRLDLRQPAGHAGPRPVRPTTAAGALAHAGSGVRRARGRGTFAFNSCQDSTCQVHGATSSPAQKCSEPPPAQNSKVSPS